MLNKTRSVARVKSAVNQIHNSYCHAAVRVEGKVFEPEVPVEVAHTVIERMSENAEASDALRKAHGGCEREQHERPGTAAALMIAIDRELSQQQSWQRVGTIALVGLRDEGTLDLGRR